MIDKEIHRARPWKVNDIARDFTLWDAWEVPIAATNSATENFMCFYRAALAALGGMQEGASAAGFLFALREWIGKIVPLDRNVNTLPIPGCREASVRDRLSARDLERSVEGDAISLNDAGLGFRLVYLFGDESLHELSNDTVHALLHMGWIEKAGGGYTATLAVYVIPRGLMGRAYLKLIEPFRRLIIYPALMKAIGRRWREHLASREERA